MYNDDANKIIKQAMNKKSAIKNSNFLINSSMVMTKTKCAPEEPNTFTKAWNHSNPNSCAKWQQAIKKEFAAMSKQHAWCKEKYASQLKVSKNKWVFKIKHNSLGHASLPVGIVKSEGSIFLKTTLW